MTSHDGRQNYGRPYFPLIRFNNESTETLYVHIKMIKKSILLASEGMVTKPLETKKSYSMLIICNLKLKGIYGLLRKRK